MNPEERQRRLACCESRPQCMQCPMRPENAARSLKDLAMAALAGRD